MSDQPPPPPPPGGTPPPPPPPPPPGPPAGPPPQSQFGTPPPPPSNNGCLKVGLIVLAVFLVLGIGGVILAVVVFDDAVDEIGEGLEENFGEADEGDYDIAVSTCEVDDLGNPTANGTIVNTSDKAQGFQIDVSFATGGNVLIENVSYFTDSLQIDQTGNWQVTSFTTQPEGTAVTCDVTQVSYTIFDE